MTVRIHTADYIKSAPGLKDCPDFGGVPELVLVGRSNVGKSSFINSMTYRKNLARTSNTPGKTRYINFYKIVYSLLSPKKGPGLGQEQAPTEVHRSREGAGKLQLQNREGLGEGASPNKETETLLFVDLPGYGYAKVSKTEQEAWRRNLEAYLEKRETIALVIQLIDARHGPQDSDIQMYEWLQFHGRRTLVVLTKMDKLSKNETANQIQKTARLLDVPKEDVLPFSAETHAGRDAAWKLLQTQSQFSAIPSSPTS